MRGAGLAIQESFNFEGFRAAWSNYIADPDGWGADFLPVVDGERLHGGDVDDIGVFGVVLAMRFLNLALDGAPLWEVVDPKKECIFPVTLKLPSQLTLEDLTGVAVLLQAGREYHLWMMDYLYRTFLGVKEFRGVLAVEKLRKNGLLETTAVPDMAPLTTRES